MNDKKQCKPCRQCNAGMVPVKPCSTTTDNECHCRSTQYHDTNLDMCTACTHCPIGEYPMKLCSKNYDTQCQKCAQVRQKHPLIKSYFNQVVLNYKTTLGIGLRTYYCLSSQDFVILKHYFAVSSNWAGTSYKGHYVHLSLRSVVYYCTFTKIMRKLQPFID